MSKFLSENGIVSELVCAYTMTI